MGASNSTDNGADTGRGSNSNSDTTGTPNDSAESNETETQDGKKQRQKKSYNVQKNKPSQPPMVFQKNKGKFKPGKSKKQPLSRLLPPKPTSTTKESLLHDVDFKAIDQHAMEAPLDLLMGSYFDLVEYLTDDNSWDDLVKSRVLFRWITSYDIMSMKIDVTPPPNSPLEYFSKIQCELGSYANLYYILCELADVPCVVIDGINKSSSYVVGAPIDREALRAQWNAVYIYDEWRIVDPFWANVCAENEMPDEWRDADVQSVTTVSRTENGSINGELGQNAEKENTFTHKRNVSRQPTVIEGTNNLPTDEEISEAGTDRRFTDLSWKRQHKMIVDEHYFYTNPSELVSTHLPDDDDWQLLEEPIPFEEFQEQAFMRERFHQLEMKIADEIYDNCVMEAIDGEAELILTLPPERSKNYKFKYVLFRSHLSAEERTRLDVLLDRFVIFEHLEDILRFSFQFPISGRFKLDIYGLDKKTPEISGYDLVCSYILVANEAQNCIPLPDYPSIGWGPGIASQSVGIEAISHKESSILTEDGRLEIVIGGKEEHKLKMSLRNPFSDEANLEKYAILRWTGNEFIINTRLPKKGMYALKIYAKNLSSKKGEHSNVLNYLVKCYGKDIKHDPFPNVSTGNIGANPACKDLGVRCVGCEDGMIYAKDGFAQMEFENNGAVDLSCELHANQPVCTERMRVTQKNGNNKNWFYLDLPHEGEYAMNIYAHKKGNNYPDLSNSHAFLVQSTGRPIQEGTVGKVKNNNFWKDVSPIIAETIYTKKPEICVPVPTGIENVLAFLDRKENDQPPSRENVEMITELGISLFKVQLPKYGEYTLNIYQQAEKVYLKNIGRYYIFRSNSVDVVEDDLITIMDAIREERLRVGQDVTSIDATNRALRARKNRSFPVDEKIARAQRLFLSLESNDPAVIKKALAEMQLTQPDQNDALVKKAKKILRYQEAKLELNHAYKTRNLPELEKAIVKAKAANTDNSLDMPLLLGRRLRDRLRVLHRLSDGVRRADYRTVRELKSYDNPPAGVHSTVKAALLLIGHPRSEVEKWPSCQAIMQQSGSDALAQEMANFDPKDISIATALEAKMILDPYTEAKMREISSGTAGVFMWAKSMIKEIEASVGTLKEKKPKPKRPVVIKPKQMKPKKKYVTITLDMLKRPPPKSVDDLVELSEKTYRNAYKRRKLLGIPFPIGHPGYGRRNGNVTVISEPVVPMVKAEAGKKRNSLPITEKGGRKVNARPQSDKVKSTKKPMLEDGNMTDRPRKGGQRNGNPATNSDNKALQQNGMKYPHYEQSKSEKVLDYSEQVAISPDFQKIPVKEYNSTGVQYTPDSESNGSGPYHGRAHAHNIRKREQMSQTEKIKDNSPIDPKARKSRIKVNRKSYSDATFSLQGLDRHSYAAIHGRERQSEIPTKPIDYDTKMLNFKTASGYTEQYELKKSFQEVVKAAGGQII